MFSADALFAQKLKTVTLGMTGKTIATVPFRVGIERGYFKQESLDVKLSTINQSDVIIKAIMSDELAFMSIIPTAILAAVRGITVQTIAVNVESAPYVLVGRPEVKSMSAMKGKKGGRELAGRNEHNSCARDRLAQWPAPRSRGDFHRCRRKRRARAAGFVDAALVTVPLNYELERKGFTRLAWSPDFVRYPLNGIAASSAFLAKNRALAPALLRAVAAGVRDVKQRKSDTLAFIKKYLVLRDEDASSSDDFLTANAPDDLMTADATTKSAMAFAGEPLKLKADAIPDLDKARDGSFARSLK